MRFPHTEPVDVVLFEGWMLGFNPLKHIPLPVYTNHTPTASAADTLGVGADGSTSSVDSAVPELTPQELAEQERELAAYNEAFAKARNIKVTGVNDIEKLFAISFLVTPGRLLCSAMVVASFVLTVIYDLIPLFCSLLVRIGGKRTAASVRGAEPADGRLAGAGCVRSRRGASVAAAGGTPHGQAGPRWPHRRSGKVDGLVRSRSSFLFLH